MKNALTLLFFVFYGFLGFGQGLSYDWAYSVGGNSWDSAEDVAVDNQGNIYVTGRFSGTCDFDPGSGTFNLTAPSTGAMFVQKVDSAGNLLWAKKIGGVGSVCEGVSIVTDYLGGIYITGYFYASVDFDPSTSQVSKTTNGAFDVFLLKLDAVGSFKWVKTMGSGFDDMPAAVCYDGGGFVYIAGNFKDTAVFDNGADVYNLVSAGQSDVFVAKYDVLGNFYWAKSFGGVDIDEAGDLSTDVTGNIYMTGQFKQIADFDPGTAVFNLSSLGGRDVFVVKVNDSGELKWAKSFGGLNDYDEGFSISLSDENVYVTGWFKGMADFDPGAGVTSLVSNGDHDVFIEKLDTSGSFVWAHSIGAGGSDVGTDIIALDGDDLYVLGNFYGTVDFGLNSSVLHKTSLGFMDVFVLKMDSLGNSEWVETTQGSPQSYAFGWGVAKNGKGEVYVAGAYGKTVDFDPNNGLSNMTSNGNSRDFYCMKLSHCAPNHIIDSVVACNSYTWINGVTYFSSNTSAKDTLFSITGCDSVVSLNLVINKVDTGVSVNAGVLTSNQVGAAYQWVDCNNGYTPILGEVNQQFTPVKSGNYAVLIDYNGCVDTSKCIQVGYIGLEDRLSRGIQIDLYPNPTSDVINFKMNEVKEGVEIRVYDARGNVLYAMNNVNRSTGVINLPSPMGVYWIEVSQGEMKSLFPVTKQ